MAMLKDYENRVAGYTNALVLPDRFDAGEWGATCATCHDPHVDAHEAQLRNPVASTDYYTLPTSSDKRTVISTNFMGVKSTNTVYYNTTFASMYNPNISVCGQCHNSRGARWDGREYVVVNGALTLAEANYSRPPHHSPQYNIFSGIVQPDYLNETNNILGPHSSNPKGCAACHMPTYSSAAPSPQDPNYTGHEFEPLLPGTSAFNGCVVSGCHDGVATTIDPTNALVSLQTEITNKISGLVFALQSWATNKGPALLNPNTYGTNGYKGANSWEYPIRGDLSVGSGGPINADQTNRIPAEIRQARFNVYMVQYGQSLGIHNPTYTRYLLNDASNKVWQASQ
jgi:cytochrome c553